ncbi:hypothetical protein AX16_010861 [Volvariella volvacea WC 439]|nr:hypothetical protein AX16_010861 [Volvariella volvacea WC 439]
MSSVIPFVDGFIAKTTNDHELASSRPETLIVARFQSMPTAVEMNAAKGEIRTDSRVTDIWSPSESVVDRTHSERGLSATPGDSQLVSQHSYRRVRMRPDGLPMVTDKQAHGRW